MVISGGRVMHMTDVNPKNMYSPDHIFDSRNILDKYKGMSVEDINASLEHSPLVACLSNELRDFNWGTVVRNANAFGLQEVAFCGRKRWDRRGAVGAQNYTNITHYSTEFQMFDAFRQQGYEIIAAEYDEDYPMHNLYEHTWNPKSLVVFGEEGRSLPAEVLDQCDKIVAIPMMGCVRSLNVGVTSGIFFSHYNEQCWPHANPMEGM